jgi:DNA-binding Lrp family transcriptional regulator
MPELLDSQLLHALQIDGRLPFSLIANTIGVSDQTVARRYRRLRSTGLLRVRGLLEPSKVGRTQWIVRIRCTPNAAKTIAEALARRVDTSWISLIAGGAEFVCVHDSRSHTDQPNPLLEKLPLSRGVLGIDAHCVLHEFFGGTDSLIYKHGPLDAAQVEALKPPRANQPPIPRHLRADDEPLLWALEHDGRATVTLMAAETGWSESRIRRRITELVEADILYFDVDFDQALLDLQMRAVMWLRVAPDQLAATGNALAEHPEVGYVAATTGATNLYCAVSCATPEALYSYLTDGVAQLCAIQHLEVDPIVRSVKNSSLRGAFTSE